MIAVWFAAALAAGPWATLHGRPSAEQVAWQVSGWVGGAEAPLAVALPAATAPLPPTPEAALRRGPSGEVVAVRADARGAVDVSLLVPRDEAVAAPWLALDGPQRATLAGHRFVPDEASALVRRVGYVADPAVSSADRRALRRAAGRSADLPVYARLEAIDLAPAGRWERRGATHPAVRAGLAALAVALGGVALALYRGLGSLARAERNQAYIDRYLGG